MSLTGLYQSCLKTHVTSKSMHYSGGIRKLWRFWLIMCIVSGCLQWSISFFVPFEAYNQSGIYTSWLDELRRTQSKRGDAGNLLRTYAIFKSSFTLEPYFFYLSNRAARVDFSRLRIGIHSLENTPGKIPSALAQTSLRSLLLILLAKRCKVHRWWVHYVLGCPAYSTEENSVWGSVSLLNHSMNNSLNFYFYFPFFCH